MLKAVSQLAPPARRRVELDALEVSGGSHCVDALQFKGGGTLQETLRRGFRHLIAAGQENHAEGCLLAECPQRVRPQLHGNLVQAVQHHRNFVLGEQRRGFLSPTLARE